MCNSYAATLGYREYVEAFSHTRFPLRWPAPHAAPNLEPRDPVRPTDPAPIIRAREDGVELAQLKWGFRPPAPKRPPVINFRSEGRRFGSNRCLIPASHFYEYTGEKYPKTRWKLTLNGEPWLCFAGLWRPAEGDWPESFTMLTTGPGPDIAPYHDRQPVVLARKDWITWLDPAADTAGLLRPMEAGMLLVVQDSAPPAGALI
ncbi:MAG TPA: SOS response-associated peptidase [Caulobacteraceae bacterium]|jgi:putative SOS response-associated peptidase YedK